MIMSCVNVVEYMGLIKWPQFLGYTINVVQLELEEKYIYKEPSVYSMFHFTMFLIQNPVLLILHIKWY